MDAPEYEVRLYLNGLLVGNVRKLAQNLKWVRRRTKVGADEIDFTLNDVLFAKWCEERGTTINEMLAPIALECRIVRDGVELVGGFLATMPGYSPKGTSADLQMRFDGFLNLLGGVYIRPIGTVTGRMDALVQRFIGEADVRAREAGKAYGFTAGVLQELSTIQHTFDNYKSTKEWICDRSDNLTGAGPFDLYFHADKTYDISAASDFGDVIRDWVAEYPSQLVGISVDTISASEISGFASAVIGIGSGEISSNSSENTAIMSELVDDSSVVQYGYYETIMQDSSVSRQETLDNNTATELTNRSTMIWEPKVSFSGRVIAPTPTGTRKIWIGDTITIKNTEDLTGMASGQFKINELSVSVSSSNAESIKPTLERT